MRYNPCAERGSSVQLCHSEGQRGYCQEGKITLSRAGIFHTIGIMATRAVKKTISLPSELARALEEQARAERKTLSGVVQEALWRARRARLKKQFHRLQNYWSHKAKEMGILSERDLERYLSQ